MRTLITVFLLTGICYLPGLSQPCKQEKLKDQKKRNILEAYVNESQQAERLTTNKGVVYLSRSLDSLGQEVWYLSTSLTDSYKKADWLPYNYYNVNDHVVLIWDTKNKYIPADSVQKQKRLQCLATLVGNKVSPEPNVEEKWTWIPVLDATGFPKLDSNRQKVMKRVKLREDLTTGGPPGATIITFAKDGSIKRSFPL